jgi:hypothetical protein
MRAPRMHAAFLFVFMQLCQCQTNIVIGMHEYSSDDYFSNRPYFKPTREREFVQFWISASFAPSCPSVDVSTPIYTYLTPSDTALCIKYSLLLADSNVSMIV